MIAQLDELIRMAEQMKRLVEGGADALVEDTRALEQPIVELKKIQHISTFDHQQYLHDYLARDRAMYSSYGRQKMGDRVPDQKDPGKTPQEIADMIIMEEMNKEAERQLKKKKYPYLF